MLKIRALFALTILLAAFSVRATSFIVPDDGVMVRKADGIVIAIVTDDRGERTPDGGIRTVTEVWIFDVIKGPFVAGQMLTIAQPGGSTPTLSLVLGGSPKFSPGDKVLLFLTNDARWGWTTQDLVLGKFDFVTDISGRRLLLRQKDEICGWRPGFKPFREAARLEQPFLEFVRGEARGEPTRAEYKLDYDDICLLGPASELTASPEAIGDYSLSADHPRWPDPSAAFETNGAQTGYADSLGSVDRGSDAWNFDEASNVAYSRGGTTAITQAFLSYDTTNAILFNDPSEEIAGSFTGSGVLARGGPWYGGTHNFGGETFGTIVNADVVFQDGVSPPGISQGALDAIAAHELGHTLGFKHPDATGNGGAPPIGPPPSDGSSLSAQLMSASLNRSSAFLSQWDIDAVRALYGSGVPVCTPVAISSHPQSATISSGTSRTLAVTPSGGSPFVYQWYVGASGDTTTPVGTNSSSFNTGALTQTTQFWVRVTNCSGANTVDSNTATITVTCTASITQHPQSQSVPVGTEANLSVSVGSGTYGYQWYRGESPDESEPLAGKIFSTLTTAPIDSTTSFWVKVTRTDCEPDSVANSNTATVTTCEVPAIVDEPQDASVTSGSGTTLSVTATGTNIFYQWYRGNSGVTSSPVSGGTNPTLATGNLTQTTKYWVRVSNNCGGTKTVNSRTVTVTVTTQCTAPQISVQPQPVTIATGGSTTLTVTATGTSLVYQWFEGATGVITKPVGTNSPSYTTAALSATTSFWVRITNGCGELASLAATVTVTAACTAPAIQQQPQSTTIAPGKTATLSVTATGTSLVYQWFEGQLGNTTKPVGTNSPSFTTPALKKNASYWVRLTNSCGQLASQPATVTVKSTRKHPVRRQ